MKKSALILFLLSSCFLLLASWKKFLPLSIIETFGFLTGALTVWLVVKENIWNWPIGIANNIFFVVLFWKSQLFADMTLQFLYIALGILGWVQWLHGGENKSRLSVSRISFSRAVLVAAFIAVGTASLTTHLRSVHDSAPFLDAITTVLSLAAQYLLTYKIIENWLVWMAADLIYIGMYFSKDLALTAILYVIFLAMCVAGWKEWRATLDSSRLSALPHGEPNLT